MAEWHFDKMTGNYFICMIVPTCGVTLRTHCYPVNHGA